jgi:RNA polymerase sigma-70 factor (ECF subfamily)
MVLAPAGLLSWHATRLLPITLWWMAEKVAPFGRPSIDLAALEDSALMAELGRGNQDAFRELFERWKRPLISYFFRSLNDYHLAEDLALQVARKVYDARERYQASAKFSTWLFHIAHNTLTDEYRRRGRRPQQPGFEPDFSYPEALGQVGPDRLSEWEEWLQQALGELPERERAVILLSSQQGLSPAEISGVMKLTANHVRVLLHQARRYLREQWRQAL